MDQKTVRKLEKTLETKPNRTEVSYGGSRLLRKEMPDLHTSERRQSTCQIRSDDRIVSDVRRLSAWTG
jgi:hypothetical protein